MGGYRKHSEPIAFVPHSPEFDHCVGQFTIPTHFDVDVYFDVNMDTGSLPDLADWDVVIDGVPTAINSVSWLLPDCARFRVNHVWPVSSGIIRLKTLDEDCKDTDGNIAIYPQQCTFFP